MSSYYSFYYVYVCPHANHAVYVCPHSTLLALFTCFRRGIQVSSYYSFYYICVLIGGEGGSGREAAADRSLQHVICVSSYYICVVKEPKAAAAERLQRIEATTRMLTYA